MFPETEDDWRRVAALVADIWAGAMFIAMLPVFVLAALLLALLPVLLGVASWGAVIGLYRAATRAPDLPQQVLQLIGLL